MQTRCPFTPVLCLALPLLTTAFGTAQTNPTSIVTVAVAVNGTIPAQGEMYLVDHEANTATKLTTPTLFVTDQPNCILMTSPVTGYVGTNLTPTANIYSFSLAGNTVTLGNNGSPLNTTATAGANIAQLTIVGSGAAARIYFVSQTAGVAGTLQSIPLTGGPVRADYDVSSLPTTLLTNALAAFGSKLYIGTWSVGATAAGELIEFDTGTKAAKKLVDLPFATYKGAGTSTFGFGCVNLHVLGNLNIVALGIYGDLLEVNPFTAQVVSHTFHGLRTSPNVTNNLINSGYFDPTTNDWVMGTRRGSVERWVEKHHAPDIITGVGSHPTATSNSVNGVFHFPIDKNSDVTFGPGCHAASSGLTPTDVASGAAVPGNANFKLALYGAPANQTFVLGLGIQKINVPFGNSGCNLLVSPLLTIGATTTAAGTVSLPAPLPASLPKNSAVHRQWVVADGAGGLVLSNARTTTVK